MGADEALRAAWPLFGLELRARGLLLRATRDEDAVALGAIVHHLLPASEHYFMPRLMTAVGATVEETTGNVLRYTWTRRASVTPEAWGLPLAVISEGGVVGMQSIGAEHFAVTREVRTGSYLDPDQRGRGLGTIMRAMVLEFAFAHLGALTTGSGHMPGNRASRAVSDRLGYEPDGIAYWTFGGQRLREQRLRLETERWPAFRPAWLDEMEVIGLDPPLRLLLGTEPPATS